jgi:hypothetical protein
MITQPPTIPHYFDYNDKQSNKYESRVETELTWDERIITAIILWFIFSFIIWIGSNIIVPYDKEHGYTFWEVIRGQWDWLSSLRLW